MLKLMYITNNPDVALIAEKYGVDRIWVDLERLGKEERQHGLDCVKSSHTISDVSKISKLLTKSEMLVRVNPINPESKNEIDDVIGSGAQIVMLPMWKSVDDVKAFLEFVDGRARTILLLETKEAEQCLDEVLGLSGIDEIYIGLNDLHLSYGLTFMFELLTNGTVERICNKLKKKGIPYGFGGVSRIGDGMLPAEYILIEHSRLGSSRVILSRGFCNIDSFNSLSDFEKAFKERMHIFRNYESEAFYFKEETKLENKSIVNNLVSHIVEIIKIKDFHKHIFTKGQFEDNRNSLIGFTNTVVNELKSVKYA